MSRTPNYVMVEDYTFTVNKTDMKTIPQGSFVRPIFYDYLPKHVLDDPQNKFFNPKTEEFVYTKWGIIPVPKDKFRPV